ncbi:MAG TPA: VWA domain-containing protein [Candidatus Acidoferrales bacterium]|nr:VWA domain-containing protein [Candidatus Acidoferrales bacterium]
MCTRKAATTLLNKRLALALFTSGLLLLALVGRAMRAAPPLSSAPLPLPGQGEYRMRRDVDMVVLYASVLDQHGNFVPSLNEANFRVYEDKVEQKLSVFRREDVPVSMGLVIDNSGSMRDKRAKVNAAALTFVETSNPQDEVFVVNFNDEFFLDLDKDFTSDIHELRDALERVDSRGGTALYAALVGSMDHLKKATHDKKVLLIITDGEDNASGHITLQTAVEEARKSGVLIYAVGLLDEEEKRAARHAKKDLLTLSSETGGAAYFPNSVEEVQSICTTIARDIRNQYVLAYYPSNSARDGSFRSVHIDLVNTPRSSGRLSVRTRLGYYAPKSSTGN